MAVAVDLQCPLYHVVGHVAVHHLLAPYHAGVVDQDGDVAAEVLADAISRLVDVFPVSDVHCVGVGLAARFPHLWGRTKTLRGASAQIFKRGVCLEKKSKQQVNCSCSLPDEGF